MWEDHTHIRWRVMAALSLLMFHLTIDTHFRNVLTCYLLSLTRSLSLSFSLSLSLSLSLHLSPSLPLSPPPPPLSLSHTHTHTHTHAFAFAFSSSPLLKGASCLRALQAPVSQRRSACGCQTHRKPFVSSLPPH